MTSADIGKQSDYKNGPDDSSKSKIAVEYVGRCSVDGMVRILCFS